VRVGEGTPSGDTSEQTGGKISVPSFFDSTTFIVHREDVDCVFKVAAVFCSPSGEIPD
jgi:hypothetical protein